MDNKDNIHYLFYFFAQFYFIHYLRVLLTLRVRLFYQTVDFDRKIYLISPNIVFYLKREID